MVSTVFTTLLASISAAFTYIDTFAFTVFQSLAAESPETQYQPQKPSGILAANALRTTRSTQLERQRRTLCGKLAA